jgi:hypothetical protein
MGLEAATYTYPPLLADEHTPIINPSLDDT